MYQAASDLQLRRFKLRHRTLLAGLGFPINLDSNSNVGILLFNILFASLALKLVVSPMATLYSTSYTSEDIFGSGSEGGAVGVGEDGGRVKVSPSENWTETH
ncbi:hypothetical protein LINPERPRIM_LOCUS35279 [Linum perenne]